MKRKTRLCHLLVLIGILFRICCFSCCSYFSITDDIKFFVRKWRLPCYGVFHRSAFFLSSRVLISKVKMHKSSSFLFGKGHVFIHRDSIYAVHIVMFRSFFLTTITCSCCVSYYLTIMSKDLCWKE